MTLTEESDAGGKDRHILVAGPPYREYLGMIGDAFKARGLRVSVLEWRYPKRNLFQEIGFYASKSFRLRLARAQDGLNTIAIEKAVEKLSPDHVLVMKAAALSPRTVKLCESNGTTLAMWAYDSAREYPLIAQTAADYDRIYTYEPNDVEMLSDKGKVECLPMGYDPRVYFPAEGSGKEHVDVCFIGSLRDTPVRKQTIRHVAGRLPNNTIGVWTDTIHWYSHRRLNDLRFTAGRRNIKLTRRTVEHAEINEVYNSSKGCLNIHHPQSVKALNPRTFEILGSGGLLLTDRRMGGLEGFEDDRGYVHYSSREDLIERLRALLNDGEARRTIAEKGHLAALKAHTFDNRALKILGDLD